MYIILHWKDGWYLNSIGYASEEEARNAITVKCNITGKTLDDFKVAKIL